MRYSGLLFLLIIYPSFAWSQSTGSTPTEITNLIVNMPTINPQFSSYGTAAGCPHAADPTGTTDSSCAVNAAINALPMRPMGSQGFHAGTIELSNGIYLFSGTVSINSPYLTLHCDPGTQINYSGNGDAVRVLTSPFDNTFDATGGVENCIFNGTSATKSLLHFGDIVGFHVTYSTFNNATGGAGIWMDDATNFTERSKLDHVTLLNNQIGLKLTSENTNLSFGYSQIEVQMTVNANQTGIDVGSNTSLYHSFIMTRGDMAGTGNRWIHLTGLMSSDEFFLTGENFTPSGTQGIVQDGGSEFDGCGYIDLSSMTNSTPFPGPLDGFACAGRSNGSLQFSENPIPGDITLLNASTTKPFRMQSMQGSYALFTANANTGFQLNLSNIPSGSLPAANLPNASGTVGVIESTSLTPNKCLTTASDSQGISLVSCAGTGTPTFTVGPAMGTGAAVFCQTGYVCTEKKGYIQLNTGTAPTAGTILSASWSVISDHPDVCVVVPQSTNLGTNSFALSSTPSNSGFSIGFTSAPAASTTYFLAYLCE